MEHNSWQCLSWHVFYAPGLKGLLGASSVWILCLSIRLSDRNSVSLINKVQYLKFRWSYSNQTWTVSSSKGCSHFTDITCPWRWGGVKMEDLEIFAIVWLCWRRGHPCFTNTCLVYLSKKTQSHQFCINLFKLCCRITFTFGGTLAFKELLS